MINSDHCTHLQVQFSGSVQGIDARLAALDYLSGWAQENNFPEQWLQELKTTRQHAKEYTNRDPKVVNAVCLHQQGY